ncbi:MAG: hypothetical protein JSR77_16245 [Planctomycetes bacterium]|nr:hypothetical protein [Planctomycetota bacterium]
MNPRPIKPTRPEAHKLRLVGAEAALAGKSNRPDPDAALRREVARENHSAGGLSVDDMRDVFAAAVVGALDGGRAAILRPQVRRRLVAGAVATGMRPFEANLVIALVQEATRNGRTVRARMIPITRTPRTRWVWSVVATLLIAAAILGAMVLWVRSL